MSQTRLGRTIIADLRFYDRNQNIINRAPANTSAEVADVACYTHFL